MHGIFSTGLWTWPDESIRPTYQHPTSVRPRTKVRSVSRQGPPLPRHRSDALDGMLRDASDMELQLFEYLAYDEGSWFGDHCVPIGLAPGKVELARTALLRVVEEIASEIAAQERALMGEQAALFDGAESLDELTKIWVRQGLDAYWREHILEPVCADVEGDIRRPLTTKELEQIIMICERDRAVSNRWDRKVIRDLIIDELLGDVVDGE
jgi:hypothetical protein